MSNLVCITSHCNNSEKIQFLKEKIKLLKQNKKNILLISHIPLDKDIVASVDHFIYDKINPLLQYPEKYSVVWKLININNDAWRLISYNPDYGWCHLNQLKIISNYCKKLQYETYTFFNYDTLITDDILKFVRNTKYNIFSSTPTVQDNPLTASFPNVIFFQLKKDDLEKLVLFDKIEYIEKSNINGFRNAEGYLKKIIDEKIKIYKTYPELVLHGVVSEHSRNIEDCVNFNNENNYFRLFNDDKFIILYELINLIKFNINGEDIFVSSDTILDLPKQIGYYDYDDKLIDITYILNGKLEGYKHEIRKDN